MNIFRQILYYLSCTGIGAHDDGSAQNNTAENSQVGHTGVISATIKGYGRMQFSHRAPKGIKQHKDHHLDLHVDLGPGSVFLMSAVCDRLLLHEMLKQERGEERHAIILRVLNQPRYYRNQFPFDIHH
jgi:hypothetical protein